MTQHTPGPWITPRNDEWIFIGVDGGPVVARIPTHTQNSFANARLIAAAPELRQELILLKAQVLKENAHGLSLEMKDRLEEARAAIVKADCHD